MRMARPGDLLLCFIDQIARSWAQVAQFRPDLPSGPHPIPDAVAPVDMPDVPEPAVGVLEAVVRDERGVRLAREQDD
jgi:hypothetical protein